MEKKARFWLACFCFLGVAQICFAHTLGTRETQCPLCGTEFSFVAAMSGNPYDIRLDFKEIGAIYQPQPIPQCPTCRYAFYDSEWEPKPTTEEKQSLNSFIASPEFKNIPEGAPSYFYLARFKEVLEKTGPEIAFAYLMASWQAEGTEELDDGKLVLGWKKDPEMNRLALEEALRSLSNARQSDEKPALLLNAAYLKVELHRRLGEFPQAEAALQEARSEFESIVEASSEKERGTLLHIAKGLSSFLDQQKPLIAEHNADPTILDKSGLID